MRKEFCALFLAFLVAFIAFPTFAQTSIKIGVVDTQKAIEESISGKKAMLELEKETEEWQKRGEKLNKEIVDLEEKLAKQRAFLDDKEEEKTEAKVGFGTDLTYFIWMTIDPLKDYLSWLPFKASLEKWVVKSLAKYGLETAMDLLKAQFSTFSVESSVKIRALP